MYNGLLELGQFVFLVGVLLFLVTLFAVFLVVLAHIIDRVASMLNRRR